MIAPRQICRGAWSKRVRALDERFLGRVEFAVAVAVILGSLCFFGSLVMLSAPRPSWGLRGPHPKPI